MTGEGWDAYAKLVMDKLETLQGDIHSVEDKLETLMIDVAMLKVKAGMWGAVAGFVPGACAVLLVILGGQ